MQCSSGGKICLWRWLTRNNTVRSRYQSLETTGVRSLVAISDLRRICVFTGSRAEYGPAVPLLRTLRADPAVELRLLVSGGHLVPSQGMTVDEIEADGFRIDERVEMVLAGDTSTAIAKSFGIACVGYADALRRINPDVLVVLGDRYETLAATIVGLQQGIVIGHIGGGQLSYGSIDNQMRHAISKMAHLHFVIDPQHAKQLLTMDEPAGRVFEVGDITFDSKLVSQLLDKETLQAQIGLEIKTPTFVVTYHPATSDRLSSRRGVRNLLMALDGFPDARVVVTSPNLDSDGIAISSLFRDYADSHRGKVVFTESLGRVRYLSLLKYADAVVGNSSSGLSEAPLFGVPTVNIGSRQDGRAKPDSVIDCDESVESITAGLTCSLTRRREYDETTLSADLDVPVAKIVHVLRDADLAAVRRKY